MTPATRLFAVAHLGIAALWFGSMAYSLTVVQPRVFRYFSDKDRREEFLTTLANGNRRPVVVLVAALGLTALGVVVTGPRPVALGYALALAPYAAAAAVFVNVSWRHWPARVFARPDEVPGFQRRLRTQAWTMLLLVGAAFGTALVASLWPV